jgi:hypothetical protein
MTLGCELGVDVEYPGYSRGIPSCRIVVVTLDERAFAESQDNPRHQ